MSVGTLPHDLDAEQAVLGCLLIDTGAMGRVRDLLTPADFYAERNGHIYAAASELDDQGENIDVLSLKIALERHGQLAAAGGIEYLADLSQKMPTTVSVRHYATVVLDLSLQRSLLNTGNALVRTASNGHFDRAVALSELEKVIATTRQRAGSGGPSWSARLAAGGQWLRTGPVSVSALWGDASTVLAARLQPTILASSTGVGKTTIAQRLVLGALGVPGFERLIGYPVNQIEGKVLFIAADRPEQARQSLLRMITTLEGWATVEHRLVVWSGPPPEDIASRPELLLVMARHVGAGLVIPDSLKDMASHLSDEGVGSRVNNAFQLLVSNGIDVFIPHHTRKVGRQDRKNDISIDDLYGSSWLYSGCGSVLYLERGALDVELIQLKTPNHHEANFRFTLNRLGHIESGGDPRDPVIVAVTQAGTQGIATDEVARKVLQREATASERERIRRRLFIHRDQGVVIIQGHGRASRWVMAP